MVDEEDVPTGPPGERWNSPQMGLGHSFFDALAAQRGGEVDLHYEEGVVLLPPTETSAAVRIQGRVLGGAATVTGQESQ